MTSFVGQDDTGSFGILAGHGRMMTALVYGLSRFRTAEGEWTYVALPGGILYFAGNALYVTTTRYFLDRSYEKISTTLLHEMISEEEALKAVKENIAKLEQEMMRRLWQIERGA